MSITSSIGYEHTLYGWQPTSRVYLKHLVSTWGCLAGWQPTLIFNAEEHNMYICSKIFQLCFVGFWSCLNACTVLHGYRLLRLPCSRVLQFPLGYSNKCQAVWTQHILNNYRQFSPFDSHCNDAHSQCADSLPKCIWLSPHSGSCLERTIQTWSHLPFVIFVRFLTSCSHAPHVTTLSDCPTVFIHVCLDKCQLFIDEDNRRLSKHLNRCFWYSG